MSGIYGVFQRSGEPVNLLDMEAMHGVFAQWFDDDRGKWHGQRIALGHTMRWVTPESHLENLPHCHDLQNSSLVITADARLDNREELVSKLGIENSLETITDSCLILKAYQRWGKGCPSHLLGDFAFAIWDEREQHVFLARDQVGVRSLYYSLSDEVFSFSNHLYAVRAAGYADTQLCDEAVQIYLKEGELYSKELTFYQGIKKLPPACAMIVSTASFSIINYWRLECAPRLTTGSMDAYEDQVREMLKNSVDCRLRSSYPVAAHLSGGLDSSAIAALASRTLFQRGQELQTYNWCPEPSKDSQENDPEWYRGLELARSLNIGYRYVNLTAENLAASFSNQDISAGNTVDIWYEREVRKAVIKAGQRVVLSGWGGDQVVSNHGDYALLDLVTHGRPHVALSLAWETVRGRKQQLRQFLGIIQRNVIRPFFTVILDKCGITSNGSTSHYARYATPQLAEEAAGRQGIPWDKPSLSVRKDQIGQFTRGHVQSRLDSWAAAALESGIEYSYPLLDRRLLELSVSLPPECCWRYGEGRYIFRRAIAGCVTDAVVFSKPIREKRRVARLLVLERQALLNWKRDYLSRTTTVQSSLVHLPALLDGIDELNSGGEESDAKKSETADSLVKAIRLLMLEESC